MTAKCTSYIIFDGNAERALDCNQGVLVSFSETSGDAFGSLADSFGMTLMADTSPRIEQ